MKKLVLVLLMTIVLCALSGCGGVKPTSSEAGGSTGTKSAVMIDVTSENLTDALADLKAAGFTNVSSNADTYKEWKENRWIVISQSVEAGENCAVNDEIKLTCKKSCLLYLDLTSESNFLFSTYVMDIYVDDELVGTVENGKTITKLMQLLEGKYTVMACKSGDNSLKATKQLTITSDITFKSDIAHSGSSIEFKNMETLDSIVGASIKVPNVTGKVLREAMTELQEAGFINVREEPYSDIWDKDNWIVTKQGVESGTEVDQNEFIQLDCIKLDQYFNDSYSGKTLAEVEKVAQKSGFSLKYVSDEDKSDLSDTINSIEDKAKEYWVVVSAEQYIAEPKTAKLYLKRESSPEEKKAEEEKKKAEEEKKEAEEEKKKAEEEKKKSEEEKKKAEEEKKKAEEEKKKAEEAENNKEATAANKNAGVDSSAESSQEMSEDDIPYHKVDNYNASAATDYVHVPSNSIILGNGENATIKISASPAGLTAEDFIFDYDEKLLEGGFEDVISSDESNTTTITFKLHAIGVGDTKVVVVSAYDYCAFEDYQYCSIPFIGLDSWEGQVVYVTPTGEKYHLSADCAGENYITTTRYDAENDGYEPCKKCAG